MTCSNRRLAVLRAHLSAENTSTDADRAYLRATPVAGTRLEANVLPSTWLRKGHTKGPGLYTPVFRSSVDTTTELFLARRAHNESLCSELQRRLEVVHRGVGGKSEALQRQRRKNLARERVSKLIDEGTDFLELSPLGAWEMFGGGWLGGGIITGIGIVAGRECVFACNDQTIKGGTFANPAGGKKYERAQHISMANHLPLIYLVDGGGAKLDAQSGDPPPKRKAKDGRPQRDMSYEGLLPAFFAAGGIAFFRQIRAEGMGIPQIAVTCGGATAGSAYFVALCQENIIVEGNGKVYLGGPPLVKAATGEDADDESLGGARMHTTVSGVVDHYAPDEDTALERCRQVIENLGRRQPRVELPNMQTPEPPLYDPETLLGLIPEDNSTPYDIREALARIVDGSRLHEFRALYGTPLVCAFAHLEGYPVGVVANNGPISADAASKGAQFVQMCGQRRTPLVFFHNAQGVETTREAAEAGILQKCAAMIAAVSNTPVPKFSVVCGDSIGPAHFCMCGPAFQPRFTFVWPGARVGGATGEQLAEQAAVHEQRRRQDEGLPAATEAELEALRKPIREGMNRGLSAWQTTAWAIDDGLIDPRDTRRVLANVLSVSLNAPFPGIQEGSLRV